MKISDLIVYEDEDLIAINKPSGLLSIPDRAGKEESLKSLLQASRENIYTVHRLDKDTSGLIIFAKNENAHRHLSMQFATKKDEDKSTITKIYVGLVMGQPAHDSGTINLPIAENMVTRGTMVINRRGKPAITDYEVLEKFGNYSWVQFRIHTGRTHQIRVHMKYLGHPIVSDSLYGDGKPLLLSSLKPKFKLSKNDLEERPILSRLALHAYRLGFTRPNHEKMELQADLPKDLKATLQQLTKLKK
ncbi:MAG TPA: RluA family pseudouridine synthase [Chitinophagaceae bacterium]|nr:RluA family pseudouridine synthase [Chitinophagaceae bacterium]